jgi:ketosteroid isomerase-like protein
MGRITLASILAAFLLLMGTAPLVAQDAAADKAKLATIFEVYVQAVNSLDAELWLSNWDENGIKMDPDTAQVVGKPAIAAKVRAKFPSFSYRHMEVRIEEIQLMGDFAFVRGFFTFRSIMKSDSSVIDFDGKFLTTCRRQSDGSWKIYRDIYNSNVPPR